MLAPRQRNAYSCALRAYAAEVAQPLQPLQHLCVRSVGRIDSVAVADIEWLQACGNYVQLHLAGRSLMHRAPLSALIERLDPADFLRVHRGAVIRLAQALTLHVAGDGVYRLSLRSGAEVPVSERYVAALRQYLLTQRFGESGQVQL